MNMNISYANLVLIPEVIERDALAGSSENCNVAEIVRDTGTILRIRSSGRNIISSGNTKRALWAWAHQFGGTNLSGGESVRIIWGWNWRAAGRERKRGRQRGTKRRIRRLQGLGGWKERRHGLVDFLGVKVLGLEWRWTLTVDESEERELLAVRRAREISVAGEFSTSPRKKRNMVLNILFFFPCK